MKKLMLGTMLTLVGCAGGAARETTATVGAAGGALTLNSGVALQIPAGALSHETEVHLRETEVEGRRHIELEPAGLRLATHGRLEVRIRSEVELGTLRVREDGASTEVESGRRGEDASRHALEIEVDHLGQLEVGDDRGTDTRPDDSTTPTAGDDHGGH